ncbi:MAG: hypothetical protein PSX79_02690 [bacterium]|nr:hypothetical protein [bacterium]
MRSTSKAIASGSHDQREVNFGRHRPAPRIFSAVSRLFFLAVLAGVVGFVAVSAIAAFR